MQKRKAKQIRIVAALAALFFLAACGETGDESIASLTQQLSGSISPDAEIPDAGIVAVDEAGGLYLFEVDAGGQFQVELPAGQSYELYISAQGEAGLQLVSQLVFPRRDGEVDSSVRVDAGMAPFDLGELRPAGALEEAEYEVVESAAAAAECEEGPAGLFCIHDGLHPGCEGLQIAAEARQRVAEGRQIADQARQAAERAGEHLPAEVEDHRPLRPESSVAVPERNAPLAFPGCEVIGR